MPRNCVNNVDNFCYICGEFIVKSDKCNITKITKKAYKLYFGCKVGDQDKIWAPKVCCRKCKSGLGNWLHNKKKSMPFAVPMVWKEPTNHINDCYFCIVSPFNHGLSKKWQQALVYPNIPFAIRPDPHSADIPIPKPPQSFTLEQEWSEEENDADMISDEPYNDPEFLSDFASSEPHLISQGDLNGKRFGTSKK